MWRMKVKLFSTDESLPYIHCLQLIAENHKQPKFNVDVDAKTIFIVKSFGILFLFTSFSHFCCFQICYCLFILFCAHHPMDVVFRIYSLSHMENSKFSTAIVAHVLQTRVISFDPVHRQIESHLLLLLGSHTAFAVVLSFF